ncbi:hypothetical protein CWATWH0005_5731 [Crocosphaera watsonii WH 0005]|uniref:Uncharacterized protein n=1 Tax=Crocosphaera watsonii WH 0005 TaxID=423472 RepID=T2IU64_CROWT|nr:hypothetical protein CWATWH0005_5731 [Crocosphaera watsonii WH 0005]
MRPSPYIWDSTTTVKQIVQRYVNQFLQWFPLWVTLVCITDC